MKPPRCEPAIGVSPPARRVRAALKMGRDLILGKRGPRRTAKPRTARYRALDGTKRTTCAEMVGKALLVGVCGLLLILVVVAYAVLDAAEGERRRREEDPLLVGV